MITSDLLGLINHYIYHPPPFPIYALVQIQKCLNPVISGPFSTLSFVQGEKGEWACFKVSHVTEVCSSRELFEYSLVEVTQGQREDWYAVPLEIPLIFNPHTQMSY